MTARRDRVVLVVAATALVAASCGGDDADAVDETAGSEDEPAEQSDEEAGDDPETEDDVADAGKTSGGTAMITIDGQEFSFTPVQCSVDADEASVVGNGATSDGEPFKGDVVIVDSSVGAVATVGVGVGNDGITASGQPEDRPRYESSQIIDPVTYEISGATITGDGPVHDSNEVAAPHSETLPMTFEITCS